MTSESKRRLACAVQKVQAVYAFVDGQILGAEYGCARDTYETLIQCGYSSARARKHAARLYYNQGLETAQNRDWTPLYS